MLKNFQTEIEFANTFNMDNCIQKYIEFKTVEDALKSEKIKLRELTSIYSEKAIVLWIQAWLVSLASYMNFSITEQQAKTTSIFILEDCYMFNIVEFTLLFKKLSRGSFGEFYGKFNGQIIVLACKQYREQRGKILNSMTYDEQRKIMS